jgi:HEAT repeats
MVEKRDTRRQRTIEEMRQALAPLIDELVGKGYDVRSLDELRRSGKKYRSAIPTLVDWLSRVSSVEAKESIVRALSVPWAKPTAGPVLIREFETAPKEAEGLRWSIGNALEVVADSNLLEKLIEIVTNKENGKPREMAVLALSKIRDPRSVEVLIDLLDDEQVAGHAVMALRKLKAPQALHHLVKFADHPQAWIRNEAKKAITIITKNRADGPVEF